MKIKTLFFLLFWFYLSGILSAQTLHNGIQLPEQWPPRYGEPKERREMPIPYLRTKPEVISVNTGRQLFVDSFLVAATTLEPVFHTPTFYPSNPILRGDKEWEKTTLGVPYADGFSDGVWYDESDDKFKLWYRTGAGKYLQRDHQTFYTCYAESSDGKHWIKQDLKVQPGTNIVQMSDRDASTTWLDKRETDPDKRFKMFNVERRPNEQKWQYMLKYSPDGIHWSETIAQSGDIYDRSTAFYNPFTNKWVLSMRQTNQVSYRSRSYLEHDDPEMAVSLAHRIRTENNDKHIVYWFAPDDKEPIHPKYPDIRPGIYNFDVIAYESIMLGFYSVWQGPDNDICDELDIQKRNEIALGYSRDGFHFSRPTHTLFMGVNETDCAWNWGNMQSIVGTPLIIGDSLYFYCSGKTNNYIKTGSYASTGLATLRRDGFVSMQAGKKEGYLLTEKLSFDGFYFFVNANVKGKLLVELVDEKGTPIVGFTKEECIAMKADSCKYLISWKKKKDLSALAGQNIQVKFYLTDGELYAFWISPWETGESRGYTAGGGPGLNVTGIDIR